jgi:hypothetical protein
MKFKVLAQVGKFLPGEIIELEENLPNLSQFIAQGFLEKIEEESSPPPSSSTGGSEEESTAGASGEKRERKTKRRKR